MPAMRALGSLPLPCLSSTSRSSSQQAETQTQTKQHEADVTKQMPIVLLLLQDGRRRLGRRRQEALESPPAASHGSHGHVQVQRAAGKASPGTRGIPSSGDRAGESPRPILPGSPNHSRPQTTTVPHTSPRTTISRPRISTVVEPVVEVAVDADDPWRLWTPEAVSYDAYDAAYEEQWRYWGRGRGHEEEEEVAEASQSSEGIHA